MHDSFYENVFKPKNHEQTLKGLKKSIELKQTLSKENKK